MKVVKLALLAALFALFSECGAYAATYYAATTGNDGNTCTQAQSVSTPKLTIGAALACMSGGDILNIRAGTYNESIFLTIPSGPSNTTRTIIQGYMAEVPTLHGSLTLALENNITWQNVNIDDSGDGNNVTDCILINSGSNITITHADISNCQRHGVLTGDGNGTSLSNLQFTYLVVHNTGQGYLTSPDPRHHNFYIAASHFTTGPILIDHVESHNLGNPANAGSGGPSGSAGNSWGIQIYAAVPGFLNSVTVSNCYVHDNNQGIVVGSGNNHKIFNNVLYNNDLSTSFGEAAITVGYGGGDNLQVYNNTIVHNQSFSAYAISVGVFGSFTNTQIKNNIMWENGINSVQLVTQTGTNLSNNWSASDPLFVNEGTRDFHLTTPSPAKNTGVNLSSVFTTDKDGTTRPSTGTWDPGAYQGSNKTTTVTPPPITVTFPPIIITPPPITVQPPPITITPPPITIP